MVTTTSKDRLKKIAGLSAAFLILLAVFFLAKVTARRNEEQFRWEQNQYGFSLSGIELTVIDSMKESAFQDSWSAYLDSLFHPVSGRTYYSRILTPLAAGSRMRLCIIYDPAEERYCLIETNETNPF